MGREGWTSMDVPSGWVQVIRGPKPPSQRWPQVQGSRQPGAGNRPNQTKMESQNVGRGRWGNKSPVVQDKISSLEAALSALGPEEIAAKEPLQEALRRAKEVSQPVRGDPDTRKAEAVAKVDRLQKALDALGSLEGPEVDANKKALVKAQDVATERPVSELFKECKEFMERSTRRIAKLKSELEAETGLLEQSRARLARKVQQAAPVRDSVVGDGPQVSSLQQMVIQLQAERDSLSQELRRSRGPHARPCGDGPPNVSNIPPLPDQAQDVEQWARCTRIRFSGSDLTRVKPLGARSCKMSIISQRWGCARSQLNGGSHRTRESDVGADRRRGCQACDQAQEFPLRVEGHQSRRGIQPRTKGQSRELSATTQASQVKQRRC